ncbi:MAG: ribosomal protein S18-alanine N-acetyltransferase [Dehalococcoidales bacterium]|nr:ribosomal protein S18-alanine N-acetyltransferase [Dehalococcoidales bacterium]
MPYIVRPMEIDDIPEVTAIERQCFSMPWPANAYRRELRDNRLSRYIVAEWVENEEAREWQKSALARKQQLHETAARGKSPVRRALEHLFQGLTRPEQEPWTVKLAGYAGLWLMLDEAHVTTIAVRPSLRGHGLGELLFVGLTDLAMALGARYMTLEVRVSNIVAQNLYKKYGFHEEGIRKRYYSDNSEDALIMWSEPLGSASFQNRLADLKSALNKKLAKAKPLRTEQAEDSTAAM